MLVLSILYLILHWLFSKTILLPRNCMMSPALIPPQKNDSKKQFRACQLRLSVGNGKVNNFLISSTSNLSLSVLIVSHSKLSNGLYFRLSPSSFSSMIPLLYKLLKLSNILLIVLGCRVDAGFRVLGIVCRKVLNLFKKDKVISLKVRSLFSVAIRFSNSFPLHGI